MKVIDGMIPVEIQIEDDGTVYVTVFPGEINEAEVFKNTSRGASGTDEDAYSLLDLVHWDDPKTWIAV